MVSAPSAVIKENCINLHIFCKRFRCHRPDLNSVRILAALPMTSSELTGIDIAAINGVIKASIANGTIIRL